MDDKTKGYFKYGLLFVFISITMFAAFNNLGSVLAFVRWVVDISMPLIIGVLIALILNAPMRGFCKLLGFLASKLKRKIGKKIPASFLDGSSLVLTLICTALIIYHVFDVVVPRVVNSVSGIGDAFMMYYPKLLASLKSYGIDTAKIEQLINVLNVSTLIEQMTGNMTTLVDTAYSAASSVVNTAINKISQPAQPVQQPAQVAIPDSIKALLPDSVRAKLDSIQAVTDSLNKQMANAENKKDLQYVHQASNVLYFGRVPGSPEVGDVRVTFEKVVPAKVTIMAVVDGDSFKPYKAKNGKRFQTLVMGKKTGDEIIEGEKEANNMILWPLRILGIVIIIGGLKGIFGFLETILKVVPFIANIFGWGVGIVCTVVGIVWSLIVIALAWLFYRPVLAISLLAIAGFLIWVFAFKGKDKLKELASKGKSNQTQPAPQTTE